MRPAAGCGGGVQQNAAAGNGRGGSRRAAQHRIRHQRRQLPHRDRRGGKRRNAGQNPERIRRFGADDRPARQGFEGYFPAAQHPRGTQVHGLHPRGFALCPALGLSGLRTQRRRIRGLRIPRRLGERPHGRKTVYRAPHQEERHDQFVALGRYHGAGAALCAGRRNGGHLPVDGGLLRHPERRQLHGHLRRAVHRRQRLGRHRPHLGREILSGRQGVLRHSVPAGRQNPLLGV